MPRTNQQEVDSLIRELKEVNADTNERNIRFLNNYDGTIIPLVNRMLSDCSSATRREIHIVLYSMFNHMDWHYERSSLPRWEAVCHETYFPSAKGNLITSYYASVIYGFMLPTSAVDVTSITLGMYDYYYGQMDKIPDDENYHRAIAVLVAVSPETLDGHSGPVDEFAAWLSGNSNTKLIVRLIQERETIDGPTLQSLLDQSLEGTMAVSEGAL